MNLRRLSIAVLGATALSGSLVLSTVTANTATAYGYYDMTVLHASTGFMGRYFYAHSSWYLASLNDEASSVIAGKDLYYVYSEHAGHEGRQVTIGGNCYDLSTVSTGLTWWWENWDNRISSFF